MRNECDSFTNHIVITFCERPQNEYTMTGNQATEENLLFFPTTIKKNKTDSQNLSFQAWNSMSSRDILAQLATARTAATTTSGFILPEKSKTDPV